MNVDALTDPHLARLIAAHPQIFRGRKPRVFSYVPSGWFKLLDSLCTDIETALGPQHCGDFSVVQIKEKFGSLRVYFRLGDHEDVEVAVVSPEGARQVTICIDSSSKLEELRSQVRALVNAAEAASTTTCEKCGAKAERRDVRACRRRHWDAVMRAARIGVGRGLGQALDRVFKEKLDRLDALRRSGTDD
jgi:hypothetical protein